MCGIAGCVSAGAPDAGLVTKMCDALVHRGPDGEGSHVDEHAAIGMRRLAIIDVAGGDQPVYNEDRTVAAVLNGELYNYRELRDSLRRRGQAAEIGPVVRFGAVAIDLSNRHASGPGGEIHLTPIEFRLLAILLNHPGKVITHRQLLREVWGPSHVEHSHYLRIYMGHLRQKLE